MFVASKAPSLLALLAISFTTLGCSNKGPDQPDLGQVRGTVTLDRQPLVGVLVVFSPEKGRQATGLTDGDGKYELQYMHHSKGAKLGKSTVGFAVPEGETVPMPVPAEYAYGSEAGLTAVVATGENTFDFALKSGD